MIAPTTPATAIKNEETFSHAVSRSVELLSCGKTALKIAKAQHTAAAAAAAGGGQQQDDSSSSSAWWACQEPNQLTLNQWNDQQQQQQQQQSQLDGLCEDGLSLLRTMDAELSQLESLVRRRGHTNDPTEEMSASVRRLEADAQELASLVKTGFVVPHSGTQYQKHRQLIATWLETVANQQMAKLKEILKVRGNVLADQAQRRKLLNPQGPGGSTSNSGAGGNGSGGNGLNSNGTLGGLATASALSSLQPKKMAPRAMDTPLFNMSPLPKPNTYIHKNGSNGYSSHATAAGTTTTTANTSQPPAYARIGNNPYASNTNNNSPLGGYGPGGYGGGGYGGGTYGGGVSGSSSGGMRQRRAAAGRSSNNAQQQQQQQQQHDQSPEEAAQIQAQIQQRQAKRQTEHRLQEAQQAERTLANLTTMFSKMTNLISQQGEVLENIEDDVEAGLQDIIGGQDEITTLYGIKKGNRGLIIKLFSLLIFLIIFMRFYKG